MLPQLFIPVMTLLFFVDREEGKMDFDPYGVKSHECVTLHGKRGFVGGIKAVNQLI